AATESTTTESATTESVTTEKITEGTTEGSAITLENIRSYVVGIDEPVELKDGTKRPLINFDNAATTPALTPVSEKVEEELRMYASVGRGFSQKSDHSTEFVYNTRQKVIQFVGADAVENEYTCVYVDNTTDGLNKLASALVKDKNDIILTTRIEHHSNDLSWRERGTVIYAEIDEKGRVKYEDIEKLLKENKVKIVSITAASNVTGYVTDVHRVAKLAHQYGAILVVDGAQIVAHRKFVMKGATPEEDVDFLVFSAHKMYSPYGGGAIVGKRDLMYGTMPEVYGGGTVQIVADSRQEYKNPPESWEAGSPNYPGIVGLSKAIDILQEVGFDKIEEHEKVLNRKLIDGLKKFDNIIIYGDSEKIDDRVGVVTFDFSDLNSYYLAVALKEYGGVGTRRGSFCAHTYVWRLKGISDDQVGGFENCEAAHTPGMIRISFGIYNTEEEVDRFLEVLPKAIEEAKKEVETVTKEGKVAKPIDPTY
ncbi:MAG: aminotransferase class V-fold PLP-dependent enzyme, partial [Eubacterium sp.]|nr:aminotransferase class V-fold PLP-dependent enzyme [Eubacterium sp.]